MMISISKIGFDFFGHQNDAVIQLVVHNLKQPNYYRNISFSYFFLLNYKSFACLIDTVV